MAGRKGRRRGQIGLSPLAAASPGGSATGTPTSAGGGEAPLPTVQEAPALDTAVFGKDVADYVANQPLDVVTVPYMLHPHHIVRRCWDIAAGMIVIYLTFWIPFDLGFGFGTTWDGGTTAQQVLYVLDILVDIFFTIDIVLNFRTAYHDDGELVQQPCLVAKYYLSGWFWVDALATFPMDRIVTSAVAGRSKTIAKLPRLLRFLRLVRLMRLMRLLRLRYLLDQLEEFGAAATAILRVGRTMFYMVVVAHLLGCAWFFIADVEGLTDRTWAGEFKLYSDTATFMDKYTTALYWAFVTVTTVGYGDIVPVSASERRFVVVSTFIGNLVFAYMIGKMTAFAARVDVAAQVFQQKMDEVNEFMRHHNLPRSLRKRVRFFYDSFWSRGVYYNEDRILGDLSFSLRRDVDFYLKREIITAVPFFQGADPNFIAEVIQRLQPRYCQADEIIMQLGEVGSEMYLLRKGEVLVMNDNDAPSHHLGPGSFFGEISLVDPTLRRTATVKAVVTCELYMITKDDFDEVLALFPDFKDAMMAIAESRLRKTMLAEQAEWDDMAALAGDAAATSETKAFGGSGSASMPQTVDQGEELRNAMLMASGQVGRGASTDSVGSSSSSPGNLSSKSKPSPAHGAGGGAGAGAGLGAGGGGGAGGSFEFQSMREAPKAEGTLARQAVAGMLNRQSGWGGGAAGMGSLSHMRSPKLATGNRVRTGSGGGSGSGSGSSGTGTGTGSGGVHSAASARSTGRHKVNRALQQTYRAEVTFGERRRQYTARYVQNAPGAGTDRATTANHSVPHRLEVLELAVFDILSKVDYLLSAAKLPHPMVLHQGLPGEPEPAAAAAAPGMQPDAALQAALLGSRPSVLPPMPASGLADSSLGAAAGSGSSGTGAHAYSMQPGVPATISEQDTLTL